MKKTLIALLALALTAGAVSCKKDDSQIIPQDDPNTTGGDNEPAYVEGFYNPGRHISSLVTDGETQTWTWDAGSPKQLVSIASAGTSYSFTYKNSGRVATATRTGNGVSLVFTFNYDEDELDRYTIKQQGSADLLADGQISHSGGKISRIEYPSIAADMILDMVNIEGINTSDLQVKRASLATDYGWTDDNVTTTTDNGTVTGGITLGLIYQLAGDQLLANLGNLQNYAGLIELILQNMSDEMIDFTVTLNNTTRYTYDAKHNPFRGFWGDGLLLNTRMLTANNCTGTVSEGNANFACTIVLDLPLTAPAWVPSNYQTYWPILAMLVNGREFPVSRDLPLANETMCTYEYNAKGYPTVINQDDTRSTVTYKED